MHHSALLNFFIIIGQTLNIYLLIISILFFISTYKKKTYILVAAMEIYKCHQWYSKQKKCQFLSFMN